MLLCLPCTPRCRAAPAGFRVCLPCTPRCGPGRRHHHRLPALPPPRPPFTQHPFHTHAQTASPQQHPACRPPAWRCRCRARRRPPSHTGPTPSPPHTAAPLVAHLEHGDVVAAVAAGHGALGGKPQRHAGVLQRMQLACECACVGSQGARQGGAEGSSKLWGSSQRGGSTQGGGWARPSGEVGGPHASDEAGKGQEGHGGGSHPAAVLPS